MVNDLLPSFSPRNYHLNDSHNTDLLTTTSHNMESPQRSRWDLLPPNTNSHIGAPQPARVKAGSVPAYNQYTDTILTPEGHGVINSSPASWRFGQIVMVPYFRPYLDPQSLDLDANNKNNFRTTSAGCDNVVLVPAIIVAVFETNLKVLPILRDEVPDSTAHRSFAMRIVDWDSDDYDVHRVSLATLRIQRSDELDRLWRPQSPDHINISRDLFVEYSWPLQAIEELDDESKTELRSRVGWVGASLSLYPNAGRAQRAYETHLRTQAAMAAAQSGSESDDSDSDDEVPSGAKAPTGKPASKGTQKHNNDKEKDAHLTTGGKDIDLVNQPLKKEEKAREPYTGQQLPNNNWECVHACKDKTACAHKCCKEGVKEKPKGRIIPQPKEPKSRGADKKPTTTKKPTTKAEGKKAQKAESEAGNQDPQGESNELTGETAVENHDHASDSDSDASDEGEDASKGKSKVAAKPKATKKTAGKGATKASDSAGVKKSGKGTKGPIKDKAVGLKSKAASRKGSTASNPIVSRKNSKALLTIPSKELPAWMHDVAAESYSDESDVPVTKRPRKLQAGERPAWWKQVAEEPYSSDPDAPELVKEPRGKKRSGDQSVAVDEKEAEASEPPRKKSKTPEPEPESEIVPSKRKTPPAFVPETRLGAPVPPTTVVAETAEEADAWAALDDANVEEEFEKALDGNDDVANLGETFDDELQEFDNVYGDDEDDQDNEGSFEDQAYDEDNFGDEEY